MNAFADGVDDLILQECNYVFHGTFITETECY